MVPFSRRWLMRLLFPGVLAPALLVAQVTTGEGIVRGEDDCRTSTPALTSMRTADFIFLDGEGPITVTGRLAETPQQRAGGMQYLCEAVMRDNPMLFVFPAPTQPAFHMNNVHAPLDILFLDDRGRINEVHRMVPGGGLTVPEEPARYALEFYAGEYERLGLKVGMRLRVRPH